MSIVFAENENNDLYLGQNGQLVLVSGLDAAAQLSKSAVEAQQGEMLYAVDRGVPTEEVVWSGAPNLQQFEFFARREIMLVDGVTEVVTFEAEVVGDAVVYTATIKTTFGEGIVSGSI